MSDRALTIILGILICAAVAFGAFWLITNKSNAPVQNNENPFGNIATGTGSNVSGGQNSSSGSISVVAKNGSVVTVPDFRQGHDSVQAGSVTSYYLTENQASQGSAAQFDITYNSDSSIILTLLAEPLGASRLAAEAALRQYFPLSDQQLCSLNVTVATIYSVNENYSGENLGLSFCKGSVPLPN